jgi:hypothetical protein
MNNSDTREGVGKKIKVPRYEPEVFKAKARGRDPDKVSETSIEELVIDDVKISSRYGDARKFETMAAVVEDLWPDDRRKIEGVFCNSLVTVEYWVVLRQWDGGFRLQAQEPVCQHAPDAELAATQVP